MNFSALCANFSDRDVTVLGLHFLARCGSEIAYVYGRRKILIQETLGRVSTNL